MGEENDSVLKFANRDIPIPLIPKLQGDEDASSDETRPKRGLLKKAFATPDRNRDHRRTDSNASTASVGSITEGDKDASASPGTGQRLQDRLFAKLLQQVIPSDNMSELVSTGIPSSNDPSRPSASTISRPAFSLPVMTGNFRRFNSRIGVVFLGQSRLIDLFSWRRPTRTLSFLAVYTFVCVDPYLLAVLPIAVILLGVMVPSFIIRHPPAPTSLPTDPYKPLGPAIAPPVEVKAVSETSKDFFRNMRDLQNSMEDFSRGHDALTRIVGSATNFSDERLSTALFLLLFFACCFLFLFASVLPWRAIFLISGWGLILSTHPSASKFFTSSALTSSPSMAARKSELQSYLRRDILLPPMPELREVEIFELQRLLSTSSSSHPIWEAWLFLSDPYAPLSPLRISQSRPKGTRFFEDVTTPKGWEWEDKKWTLDLRSRDWVAERMITGVECQVEGERWVFDLVGMDGEVVVGAESGYAGFYGEGDEEGKREGVKRGEWRRRRWIRMVRRKSIIRTS